MKIFVGAMTAAGHVSVVGPFAVVKGGSWHAYIPQGAQDPITAYRVGGTKNWDAMADESPVTTTTPEGSFLPPLRLEIKLTHGAVTVERQAAA